MIQKSLTGSRTGVDACGSEVSPGGTDEGTAEAGSDKDTDSGRGTDADAVPETSEEKYRTNSKNMKSADTKYFLV